VAVGVSDQTTDAEGQFRIPLTYHSVSGLPPLDADGKFRMSCIVASVAVSASESVLVPFAPTRDAQIFVTVPLRQAA
jgi:hypothetical protein